MRPVIVYGLNSKANVALLAKLAALPVPWPFGQFRNLRSLLAFDNLVAAIVACLDDPRARDQTYLLNDPEPITLADVFAVMRRAAGRMRNVIPVLLQLFKALLDISGRVAVGPYRS